MFVIPLSGSVHVFGLIDSLTLQNCGITDAAVHALLQPAQGGEARQLALGLWERAQEAIAAGKLPAAQADLERGLALAPKEAGLRATLGALHLRRGRHADARQAYQEAIKLDPRPASSYLGLGLALEGLHEGARAAKAYEEFLRLAADQADQAARVEQVKARLQALRQ